MGERVRIEPDRGAVAVLEALSVEEVVYNECGYLREPVRCASQN